MRSDLGPPHARHADDFAPRLKAQKLHERVLHDITPDDVDAGFHQQANGGCAGPGQLFPGEFEVALISVALRDHEVMPPVLSLSFPLEAKLMRPGHGVDAILGDTHPPAGEQRGQPAAALVIGSFGERPLRRGAAPAAVCLDVRSRHVLAHVFAVLRVLLEPHLEIALDHPLKLRAWKFPLELGRADGALRQDVLQLLGVSGNVWIGVGWQIVDRREVGKLIKPVRNGLVENSFLALVVIVEPALIGLLIVVIQQVRFDQLVHEGRHAAQDLLGDHRGPDAQRKLLGGLLIGDLLGRPWSQVPRRLLRGIGRALRHVVPGSDRRSLGPLARGLLAEGPYWRLVSAITRL